MGAGPLGKQWGGPDYSRAAILSEVEELKEHQSVKKNEPVADVHLGESAGIYESVLVASFGGVKQELGKGDVTRMHPLPLLLLAMPVLAVQISFIFTLRLDIRTTDKVIDEAQTMNPYGLLRLQIALICVVYLSNFKTFANATAHLVFVLNPFSWYEAKYLEYTQVRVLKQCKDMEGIAKAAAQRFTDWCLFPCALVSILMRLTVTYLVCVDSTSIILRTNQATDAIFNSLAITFVTELNAQWWGFCVHAFRFQSFDAFTFKLRNDNGESVWKSDGGLSENRLRCMWCSRMYKCLHSVTSACCWRRVPQDHSGSLASKGMQRRPELIRTTFLRVGFGARRVQQVVSVVILLMIFFRQMIVVLYAIDTNVLPSARDLCEEYLLSQGLKAHSHPFSTMAWDMLQLGIFVNQTEGLEERAERENKKAMKENATKAWNGSYFADLANNSMRMKFQERCRASNKDGIAPLGRMEKSQISPLLHKYWHQVVAFSALMALMLLLPSVSVLFFGRAKTPKAKERSQVDEEQDAEISDLEDDLDRVDKQLAKLQRDVKRLQRQPGLHHRGAPMSAFGV